MAEALDARKEGIREVWDVKSYRAALRAEAAEIRESLTRKKGEDQVSTIPLGGLVYL